MNSHRIRALLALTALAWQLPALAQITQEAPPPAGNANAASHASTNAPVVPMPATASGALNPLTQSALQQGMLNCVGRINQVAHYVGFGAQGGAVLMAPGDHLDQRLTSYSMELPSVGQTAYVSATFAPGQVNGCGAVYEAVVYWKQACESLMGKEYAALKRVGQLKSSIAVLDAGSTSKVFLMPAGSGCLSIKKEIVL